MRARADQSEATERAPAPQQSISTWAEHKKRGCDRSWTASGACTDRQTDRQTDTHTHTHTANEITEPCDTEMAQLTSPEKFELMKAGSLSATS
jgi:hypothetical protein